jgi:hypothetical protein
VHGRLARPTRAQRPADEHRTAHAAVLTTEVIGLRMFVPSRETCPPPLHESPRLDVIPTTFHATYPPAAEELSIELELCGR